jgi:hypothetical protein
MNLLCATDLRGAQDLNIPQLEAKLDQWAGVVGQETDRSMYRFRSNPGEYNNSEAYFRMLVLVTVLEEDLGVHYNPARIDDLAHPQPDRVFYADSRDIFIQGLLGPNAMGTCSSMPVLDVAVGRRLGYPLKLAPAKAHWFIRWEDNKERLDIEGTSHGLLTYDDDFYKTWPYAITDAEAKNGYYLKSLTPTEELSGFLDNRAQCLMAVGRFTEAQTAVLQAQALTPYWPMHKLYLAAVKRRLALARDNEELALGYPSHAQIDAIAAETDREARIGRQRIKMGLSPMVLPYAPPSPALTSSISVPPSPQMTQP